MALGKRLAQLRKKLNKKQEDVAKDLGVARSTYGAYEQGKRDPDQETLIKLSDYYDVSVDYLLGRTEKIKIEPESDKESLFFFDQENITPEEAEELKKHLEFLRYKARQENEKK